MNKKKITYIFGGGRKKKIEYGGEFAEDMFYGYFGLNEKYDVQIYEIENVGSSVTVAETILRLLDGK